MTLLRVTVAQLNPTVGDFAGNVENMLRAARTAEQARADLVVFPELSLTGYHPGDLLDEPAFTTAIEHALEEVAQKTRDTPSLAWVVGAPLRRQGPGKRWHNSLLVVSRGEFLLTYQKQLLPTYDVFDERRHFEPGPDTAQVLQFKDVRVGFLICEDGWNDALVAYAHNPFERLADAGPDLVISINASPSNVGKREERHALFTAASRRHGLPLLYVNQVGGHDQIVFDGASFAVMPSEGVVFEANRFAEDVITLDFASGAFIAPSAVSAPAEGLSVMEFYRRQIVLGLRDYARRSGFSRALVGCSGGIDSALTLALAVEALGADKVVAVTMPSHYSSTGSVEDSRRLCENLGVRLFEHPIRDLVDGYTAGFHAAWGQPLDGVALENVQARIRGTILMEYSNAFGHLLLTTGNKSELSVGYCTLYGDTNGGLGLIGDLYKTEVFELSRHLNREAARELVPQSILDKEPSAELAPGQRDTDSLPPYTILDTVLKLVIEGQRLGREETPAVEAAYARIVATDEGRALVRRVRKMVARNEYKRRQEPPILRVRGRAFGSGRQMPIAASYDFWERA